MDSFDYAPKRLGNFLPKTDQRRLWELRLGKNSIEVSTDGP